MPIITLTTDFTEQDGYPAMMKGAILGIAPECRIVDLCHSIAPQDILSAAMLLGRCAPFFTAGTIHLVVVDPGVGTSRRPIAARLGEQYFVGPDNGLITCLYQRTQDFKLPLQVIHLNNPRYWLGDVSSTFHGRDIFTPVAAHMANGTALDHLGEKINDPVLLTIPVPRRTADGWESEVMHVDAFGNLATNLTHREIGHRVGVDVKIKDVIIRGLRQTFAEAKSGELIALWDSAGYLSIAMVNGNASQELQIGVGESVRVVCKSG